MSVLPDKPSDLIETALKDLEAVEVLPETYRVDMAIWHSWESRCGEPDGYRCYVCFAGAVMARSLATLPEDDRDPSDFDEDYAKLNALNYFRAGDIRSGLMRMRAVPTWSEASDFQDRYVPPYYRDGGKPFKIEMRKMVEYLREKGL